MKQKNNSKFLKPVGLKISIESYKKFKNAGFDFRYFDYKANLVYQEPSGETITIFNALMYEDYALVVNREKTKVLIVPLNDNPNLKIVRIDMKQIN